ncbi:hypothetical protein COT42_02670 [Candidatus Saganbacteria bacterium CG08_land_8_20_14_0_20_45_16]|uniref:Uncharacterized protein n=1 Tax=Candidatus Saganbacteria bacterium CG08_land_8_20_14_0_20_45_16 TaxID=2014293 RepID=A0A2H0XZQ9_UNCSA|nr:MAG: hypothetical protein COT42_02670 [Candidatus Saganbacteria bacterium CG08_land_8_20_14_0_20_45_16]
MKKTKAEKIKEYMKMAAEDTEYLNWCSKLTDTQRLKWLEDANGFLRAACSDKIWKIRMKMRELGA